WTLVYNPPVGRFDLAPAIFPNVPILSNTAKNVSLPDAFTSRQDDNFTTANIGSSGGASGWTGLGMNVAGLAQPEYDATNSSFNAHVFVDATRSEEHTSEL